MPPELELNCDVSNIHTEVQRVLCPEFTGYGRNLDALADILTGGFGPDLSRGLVLLRHKKLEPKVLKVFLQAKTSGLHLSLE